MNKTDRLAEIKERHRLVHRHKAGEDIDWLISEVERLRAVPHIDNLLSGEMVAVNQWPGVTQEEADRAAMSVWKGRQSAEEWRKSRAERNA